MEADWDEIGRIGLPPPGVRAVPTPVSAMAFDTKQELFWAGNEYGRITSFYGPELQKYTSFRAHPSSEGPVKQILLHERGVVSVASRSVHMSLRRGLAQWHISHDDMRDLRCMSYTSRGPSEILVAGCQSIMYKIDVERGRILEEVSTDDHYTMMKRSHYICAATSTGSVNILDPSTLKSLRTWRAHTAWINDMDAQNNFLVTCGFSPRQQQNYMLDPLANVFDLKNLVQLPPIPFHAGAAFVRMHPRMSTTSVVVSQSGQMQVVDLMNPNTVNLRQANVSTYITALDLAPSGEALALADGDCSIHLWGSPAKIHFAEFSNPTEFEDSSAPPSSVDWTAETPLSSIGMPYYREQLLSAWPSYLTFEVGNPPPRVDPEVLISMTPADFGGYAPNPRKTRRNQVENTRAASNIGAPLVAPKFLSEKAREAGIQNIDRRMSDVADFLGDASLSGITKAEVPVMYRNVEIKYSKFGVDDFDFRFYNKTNYSGLETHIANSYLNPLLQLMKFTPMLRSLALYHAATSCLTDPCLLCELGFLFDMLEKANGQNCQATNFLKSFSNIPRAGLMGLLEESSPSGSLTGMIQLANRFLLEQISSDFRIISPGSSQLDETLATAALSNIHCIHCRNETVRPGGSYVTELAYPLKGKPLLRNSQPSFSQILKKSVESEQQTRGWCDKCRRYQQLSTKKTVQKIPHVLMINAAANTTEAKQLWTTPAWLPREIGIIIDAGHFYCYEGEDLRLRLLGGNHYITIYELVGMVADINSGEHQKSHLVSIIDVRRFSDPPQAHAQWHLFNDFLVRSINQEDAFRFESSWKLPSILAFQVKQTGSAKDDSWKDKLDTSLLYEEFSFSQHHQTREARLLMRQSEAPSPQTLVAIDAEFVALQQEEIEIKADGTRETIRPSRLGLARVSVLRGSGIDESVPFIDDYIASNEPVVDYLTAFSGIRDGDLDPKHSSHKLVPLKVAYKKLWLLLNLGCVFVGHGLPKDFRTINIHVPRAQVLDTFDLFYIRSRQRRLSLRFLAWFLLKEDIQLETHDSIEDARTALRLYRKYEEFLDAGVLEAMLNDIYAKGREVGYKAPSAHKLEGGDTGGRDTPPILQDSTSSRPSTPVRRGAGTGAAQRTPGLTPGKGVYFASPLR
ncbi:MAG: poly(A)-specific ribonuclease [Candelina mexicana]|nr:MAG: poly(A)-specific ribonuclease [Candelina mexicana]